MVLVEHDAVVVLATSVTATARMLPVLADTPMTGADMPPLLTVLAEACGLSLVHSVKWAAMASAAACRAGAGSSPMVGSAAAVASTWRSSGINKTQLQSQQSERRPGGAKGG